MKIYSLKIYIFTNFAILNLKEFIQIILANSFYLYVVINKYLIENSQEIAESQCISVHIYAFI